MKVQKNQYYHKILMSAHSSTGRHQIIWKFGLHQMPVNRCSQNLQSGKWKRWQRLNKSINLITSYQGCLLQKDVLQIAPL